jgi:release factor glutamine methyltransferase
MLGSYELREAQSIARIVFEDCFGVQRAQFADFQLKEAQSAQLLSIFQQLVQQQPLQYILGQADFFGLQFKVDPRVLIPRPETEELLEWVLETIPPHSTARILDIGTGSGCIPIVLKAKLPGAEVWGLDISAGALEVAAENARLHATPITWLEADILAQEHWPSHFAPGTRFDCIISNPPYIPWRERALMPAQVQDFEPHLALFVADEDPLLFYRVIAQFAQRYLRPGGQLFFECNEYNAQEVADLLRVWGGMQVELRRDLSGKERMIRGVSLT